MSQRPMALQRPVADWLLRLEDHGKAVKEARDAELAAKRAAREAAEAVAPPPAAAAEPDSVEPEPAEPQPVSPWCSLLKAATSLLRWLRGGGQ